MRFSHRLPAWRLVLVVAVMSAAGLHVNRALAGGPPGISEFTVVFESLDTWTAYGEVADEQPGQCTVALGGLFTGHSVTPDAQGYFEITIGLDPGVSGIVSAVATDPEGKSSGTAQDYIQ